MPPEPGFSASSLPEWVGGKRFFQPSCVSVFKRSFVVSALLLAGCATPTATRQLDGLPFSVSYDHTALHVADLETSVAFYERIFGLAEIEAPGDPTIIRWLSLGGDDQLHLIDYDGEVPATTKAVHFALVVSDLDALVAHVEALGVPYSDWPGAPTTLSLRPDGVQQIYVQDPDGYWIEVNDARY